MKFKITKIVSLLICVCMIISGMVISASAAETQITFEFGANGAASHYDGSEIKANETYTEGDYSLTITNYSKCYSGARDAKGNSALKLGTSGAIGKFTIVVPDDVVSVIFNVAKYKAKTSKISINSGATKTLSKSSDNGEYEAITVDTTSNKTINFTTVSTGYRCMINSIIYVVETTTSGGEGGEGGETPDPEVPDEPEVPEVQDPTPDTELTIEAAAALGLSKEHDNYTEGSYYVTGIVVSVANTTYGNMTIKDANDETKTLDVFGTYSADGSTRYDAMEIKPEAGDTVKLYGIIGQYNGTAQMKNAKLIEHVDINPPVEPEPDVPGGDTPQEPTGNTATLTFDNTSKRTEFSSTKQVWVENGVTVTNTKTSSSSNIADNSNPIRFYKNSILMVAVSDAEITQIVFDTNSTDYATAMKNSITDGGTVTVSSDKVTFIPTNAADSFEFTLSGGQVRMDSITVTYAAKAPVAEFEDTQVDVNDDLALNQTVTVNPEDIKEGESLEMQFTMNGVTTKVSYDASQIVGNQLTFTYDNIGVQCMAENIEMKLVTVDGSGEKLITTENFSVRSYAEKLLALTTDENTKNFVSNMLHYGAAAQKYLNPNVEESKLANYNVAGIVPESEVNVPEQCKMSLSKSTSSTVYFKGATVRFDGVNSLIVKLNAKTDNTKVFVNGTLTELDGLDCVIANLKATDYAKEYTFVLKEGEDVVQTLTYNINSYAYSKQTSTTSGMANLAKALYAYGVSASALGQ